MILEMKWKHLRIIKNFIRFTHSDSNSPLSDIKVIDLTRIIAGPFCTMTLGDLGAEVYKVEMPGSGDECRRWGPPFINNTLESCYFAAINRNKKSICVNIRSIEGRKVIYDLAKKCDVLVENYVPGKLDKYKLGYDDLKQIAPHLIYCSITGYGSEGPYRHRPGYDVIAASVGGFLHITGPMDGEPVKAGVAVTDIATGLYAHGAIMAALLKRMRTKKGQKIDCNLLSTQLASLINIGSNYLNAGKEAKRLGTSHESIVPYEAFPTADGYLTLGTGSDDQFVDLCKRLGVPDLPKDDRFKTNGERVKNKKIIVPIINEIMKKKSKKQWMEIFEGATFPCGPVNTLAETFNDSHIKEIGLIKEMEHPVAGSVKVVGPPVVYSDGGCYVRSPPPVLGQHTNEILQKVLGYDDNKIQQLIEVKAVE